MWDSHHLPLAVNILGKLYFSYSLIFNLNVCVSLRLISPVDSGCKSKSSSTGAEVGKSATSLSKVSGIPKSTGVETTSLVSSTSGLEKSSTCLLLSATRR